MVVMVVKADQLDFMEFHRWLDINDPGWTWLVPHRKGQASTVREGNTADRDKLEWIIDSEKQMVTLRLRFIGSNSLQGPFRIHYRLSSKAVAMLAKLTWGHMKPYRLGTSA